MLKVEKARLKENDAQDDDSELRPFKHRYFLGCELANIKKTSRRVAIVFLCNPRQSICIVRENTTESWLMHKKETCLQMAIWPKPYICIIICINIFALNNTCHYYSIKKFTFVGWHWSFLLMYSCTTYDGFTIENYRALLKVVKWLLESAHVSQHTTVSWRAKE